MRVELFFILLSLVFVSCGKGALKFSGPASVSGTPYQFQGQLNASFGTAGIQSFANAFASGNHTYIAAATEASNGFIYTLSYAQTPLGSYKPYLRKLSALGALDMSFGSGGFFEIPTIWGAAAGDTQYYHMAVASGRYILMEGFETLGADVRVAVAVFDTQTDALLPSFGTGGVVTLDLGHPTSTQDYGNAIAFDQYRNLIIVGSRSIEQPGWVNLKGSVFALDWTGALSSDFNSGSVFWPSHPSMTESHLVSEIIVLSNSYMINTFHYDDAWTHSEGFISKIDPTGTPVPAFGTNGTVIFSGAMANVGIKIHAGQLYLPYSDFAGTSFGVARASLTTGALDLSFGTGGLKDLTALIPAAYSSGGISTLLFHPDGKVLIQIGFGGASSASAFAIADDNFDLLPEYASSGLLIIPNPIGGTRMWNNLASIMSNGQVLLPSTCDVSSSVLNECISVIK